MILVVSPGSPARLLLELSVSVTLESLVPEPAEGDDRVQDDDEGEELPGRASADEPGTSTEELDSSTGAALLLSSPQATSPMAMETSIAGNANRFILTS